MNIYEEYQKDKENFIKAVNESFNNYLAERKEEFNFTALLEFSKNELYIEYATDPTQKKSIKSFLESQRAQLEAYCHGDKAQAVELMKDIYKRFPNTHIKPWGNYVDSVVNFDDSKDYKSKIFDRRFPVGTISYIGARPGRGKTTILVNIALDALRSGKPVVFATAEETTKQIITRFILSETYTRNIKNPKTGYESLKPRTALFNYFKDSSKTLQGLPVDNSDLFSDASETIQSYIESQKLTIFEAYGATWGEFTDYLSDQQAGTLILVDYIQHLKSPEHLATQTRQIQIQETSHQLADLAGVHGLIIISGAQFNRPKTDTPQSIEASLKKPDSFNENSFREAGDIEQDGHILIGIGKNPASEDLFFSCMKDREASPDNGKCWRLKKNLAFSFLQGDKDDQGNPIEYKEPPKPPRETGETQTQEDKLNAMKNFTYGRK